MRVLIVGAGIIGSIYGWALAQGGHQVVHWLRPGRLATLSEGLEIDMYDRRRGHQRWFSGVYKLEAAEELSSAQTFDLVIVPVKHYGLIAALQEIVPRLGSADFLLLTQNWRGTQDIDPMLPRSRYIYGDAKAGGMFSADKLIAALAAIDLGAPEGPPSPLAQKVASLFTSIGMPARLHPDMLHYLWIQYAITGGLWAALFQAGSFDALLNDAAAMSAAAVAACECLEVAKQRGVSLSQYKETSAFLNRSALRQRINLALMRWMFRHDEYTKRCSAHAFGDPLEVKVFYDDLIGTGHDLGVPMPVIEGYGEAIRRFAATANPQTK